jgi:hypothetical protein
MDATNNKTSAVTKTAKPSETTDKANATKTNVNRNKQRESLTQLSNKSAIIPAQDSTQTKVKAK